MAKACEKNENQHSCTLFEEHKKRPLKRITLLQNTWRANAFAEVFALWTHSYKILNVHQTSMPALALTNCIGYLHVLSYCICVLFLTFLAGDKQTERNAAMERVPAYMYLDSFFDATIPVES